MNIVHKSIGLINSKCEKLDGRWSTGSSVQCMSGMEAVNNYTIWGSRTGYVDPDQEILQVDHTDIGVDPHGIIANTGGRLGKGVARKDQESTFHSLEMTDDKLTIKVHLATTSQKHCKVVARS